MAAGAQVNAPQNSITWLQYANGKDLIHLDINGRDYTNYVTAAQNTLGKLTHAVTLVAASAAVFAITSTVYSPQGAATIAVASAVSFLIVQLAADALANRFPDSTIANVARFALPAIAGIAATIMTGNAVGIPMNLFAPMNPFIGIALENNLRLAAAGIAANLVSSLLTYPGIERGVEFVLDRIPNMETRTVRITGRLDDAHEGRANEAHRNMVLHQNEWNQFVNRYANDRFDPQHPNGQINIRANAFIDAALALG